MTIDLFKAHSRPNQSLLVSPLSRQETSESLIDLKEKIRSQVVSIGRMNPQKASMISHFVASCNWTDRELDRLRDLGLQIGNFSSLNRLLGGGLEDLAADIINATLSKGIELLIQGNEEELKKEVDKTLIKASITLPDGRKEEGTHKGTRLIEFKGNRLCCCWPLFEIEATGEGIFQSAKVTYKGSFFNNLFHDQTGNAQYFVDSDIRYTGCFKEGMRHGHGTLEKYDLRKARWYTQFEGSWREDRPFKGYIYTSNGEKRSYEDFSYTTSGSQSHSTHPDSISNELSEKDPLQSVLQIQATKKSETESHQSSTQTDIVSSELCEKAHLQSALQAEEAARQRVNQKSHQIHQLGMLADWTQKTSAIQLEAELERYQMMLQERSDLKNTIENTAAKVMQDCLEESKRTAIEKQKKIDGYEQVNEALKNVISEREALINELKGQLIPSLVTTSFFGAGDWNGLLGTVSEFPRLPNDIATILKSPCPFVPNKGVGETHFLAFIPMSVNNKPLTLNYLKELIQNLCSKNILPNNHRIRNKPIYGSCKDILAQYGDTPIESSRWILMSTVGVRNPQEIPAMYSIPTLLEAAAALMITYIKRGSPYYHGNYIRCQSVGSIYPIVGNIGEFGNTGLCMGVENLSNNVITNAIIYSFVRRFA